MMNEVEVFKYKNHVILANVANALGIESEDSVEFALKLTELAITLANNTGRQKEPTSMRIIHAILMADSTHLNELGVKPFTKEDIENAARDYKLDVDNQRAQIIFRILTKDIDV